ncbi:hypothetical protein TWF481_010918 [Arthrobotrys musiformis]|uniref:Uncharacterized protein n=1 Tax=Arthrobotrys musiformis TaxID=47236 RepID=A0AAV9VXW3_9PEZI
MPSRRDHATHPEGSPDATDPPTRNGQRSGSGSSWFARTFLSPSSPSSPAAPRQRESRSHTTRQRQKALEQALRGQISLPTPLPQARQSPSNMPNRNVQPVETQELAGPSQENNYSSPDFYVASRPAPSPPSRNTALTPPTPARGSRLPTYGGRPIQGSSSPSNRPSLPTSPRTSPRRYVPPAVEIQVPPGRAPPSGPARGQIPMRNSPTSSSRVQSENVMPTPSSNPHPIQQRVSPSAFSPQPKDSGSTPRSKMPAKIVTPTRKSQAQEAQASPVSDSLVPPVSIEQVNYNSGSNSPTAEVASTPQKIYTLSEPPHIAKPSPKGVPESSSRFPTTEPVKDLTMSRLEPSPQVPRHDSVVKELSTPKYSTKESSNTLTVTPSSHPGVSRRPSPNTSASRRTSRSSTPSRNGNPDFASETPEQRGARHASNQAVYDRMSPVLREARSAFDLVRDWVAENSGVMNEENEALKETQQSDKVVKQAPEKVSPIAKDSAPVAAIPELLVSDSHERSHDGDEHPRRKNQIERPDIKPVEKEEVKVSVIGHPEVSTLNGEKPDAPIASTHVPTRVVRTLRRKASFLNLRAPETIPMLPVTDDDFDDEIPTGIYLSDGEDDVKSCKALDYNNYVNEEDVLTHDVPLNADKFSSIEDDIIDYYGADVTDMDYQENTPCEETKAPIDDSMSLVSQEEKILPQDDFTDYLEADVTDMYYRTNVPYEETEAPNNYPSRLVLTEEEKVADEHHAPVQTAFPDSNVPLDTDQFSGVHPLIAAAYPWNPHFPGVEEVFGGPVIVIPPPTTADGYLNIQAYWSDGRPLPVVRHGEFDVENCYSTVQEIPSEIKEQQPPLSPQPSLETVATDVVPTFPKLTRVERRKSSRSSSSSSSSRPPSHARGDWVARKTRRTKAMRKLNMQPTELSTIDEESEGEDTSETSTLSSPASGILQCQVTMSEWLLSTAIVDDKGGIWIPPVSSEKEFTTLDNYDALLHVLPGGDRKTVVVGNGLMVFGKEEEEGMERHLLPLRSKRAIGEEVERERHTLLKRWADNDVTILEIPASVLRRIYDKERGMLRSVTEMSVEEVGLIVRETRKAEERNIMRRVKLDATTVGSSKWLRMSPWTKRRFVKSNLTGLKERMEFGRLARGYAGDFGGKRKYRGRRKSETFVVFEARRKAENHENAPPVLGIAVGRPREEKKSLWTRCGEAVQGFFRAAVALSSQPKPQSKPAKEKGDVEVVRVGRGLRRVQRGDSSVIALRAPPTQVDEASDLGNQKTHRRKRSVVRGFLNPILPKVGGESKVARKD